MSIQDKRKFGGATGKSIGCLADIVLLVGLGFLLGEDTMVNLIAYMIVFGLLALVVGWIASKIPGLGDLVSGSLAFLSFHGLIVLCALLAIFRPLETEDKDGLADPEPGKAERAEEAAPPGIRYTPAA